MDDLTILSIGRQYIELSIQREQLYRQVLALQAENEAFKAKEAARAEKAVGASKPKLVGKPQED